MDKDIDEAERRLAEIDGDEVPMVRVVIGCSADGLAQQRAGERGRARGDETRACSSALGSRPPARDTTK